MTNNVEKKEAVEEENKNVEVEQLTNELSSQEPQDLNEEPRRKRRRSSASS